MQPPSTIGAPDLARAVPREALAGGDQQSVALSVLPLARLAMEAVDLNDAPCGSLTRPARHGERKSGCQPRLGPRDVRALFQGLDIAQDARQGHGAKQPHRDGSAGEQRRPVNVPGQRRDDGQHQRHGRAELHLQETRRQQPRHEHAEHAAARHRAAGTRRTRGASRALRAVPSGTSSGEARDERHLAQRLAIRARLALEP